MTEHEGIPPNDYKNGWDMLSKITEGSDIVHEDGTVTRFSLLSDENFKGKVRGAGNRRDTFRSDLLSDGVMRRLWILKPDRRGASIEFRKGESPEEFQRTLLSYSEAEEKPFTIQIRSLSHIKPHTIFGAHYNMVGDLDTFSIELSLSLRNNLRSRKDDSVKKNTMEEREKLREELNDYGPNLQKLVDLYRLNPELFMKTQKRPDSVPGNIQSLDELGASLQKSESVRLARTAASRVVARDMDSYMDSLTPEQNAEFSLLMVDRLSESFLSFFSDRELKALGNGVFIGNLDAKKLHEDSQFHIAADIFLMKSSYEDYLANMTRTKLVYSPLRGDTMDTSYTLKTQAAYTAERLGRDEVLSPEDALSHREGVYDYSLTSHDNAYTLSVTNLLKNTDYREIVFPKAVDLEIIKKTMITDDHHDWIKTLQYVPTSFSEPF